MADWHSEPGRGFTSGNIAVARTEGESSCIYWESDQGFFHRLGRSSMARCVELKMRSLILLGTLLISCNALAASASKTETNLFGFTGPETYPIDNFIAQLRVSDLDGDGLNDLVVANNSRSKITLLYNQTG